MAERVSSIEAVRQFYKDHELAFAQAARPNEAGNAPNQFSFSGEQFDQWAVRNGYMTKLLRDADDLEHGGVIFERLRLRERMNKAARKGDGVAKAYTIEARGQRWRVVLLEQFVVEQPRAIVAGIRTCLSRSDRNADQCNKFLDAQENLTDDERLLCRMRLEMAQMYIFNGMQMMEMIIMGFDAEKAPNLKRLRRRMAEVLLREKVGGKAVARRTAAKRRKQPA